MALSSASKAFLLAIDQATLSTDDFDVNTVITWAGADKELFNDQGPAFVSNEVACQQNNEDNGDDDELMPNAE